MRGRLEKNAPPQARELRRHRTSRPSSIIQQRPRKRTALRKMTLLHLLSMSMCEAELSIESRAKGSLRGIDHQDHADSTANVIAEQRKELYSAFRDSTHWEDYDDLYDISSGSGSSKTFRRPRTGGQRKESSSETSSESSSTRRSDKEEEEATSFVQEVAKQEKRVDQALAVAISKQQEAHATDVVARQREDPTSFLQMKSATPAESPEDRVAKRIMARSPNGETSTWNWRSIGTRSDTDLVAAIHVWGQEPLASDQLLPVGMYKFHPMGPGYGCYVGTVQTLNDADVRAAGDTGTWRLEEIANNQAYGFEILNMITTTAKSLVARCVDIEPAKDSATGEIDPSTCSNYVGSVSMLNDRCWQVRCHWRPSSQRVDSSGTIRSARCSSSHPVCFESLYPWAPLQFPWASKSALEDPVRYETVYPVFEDGEKAMLMFTETETSDPRLLRCSDYREGADYKCGDFAGGHVNPEGMCEVMKCEQSDGLAACRQASLTEFPPKEQSHSQYIPSIPFSGHGNMVF